MRPNALGVIGLGALGGSVAWQAARAGVPRILGYSRFPKDGVRAVKAGAITDLAPNPRYVAAHADLLVIATPPAVTVDLLRRLGPVIARRGMWCTDVASVKAPIVEAASTAGLAQCFAGSHPLTGTHVQGFAGAAPARFRDALVYVTPAGEEESPAREIADFWSAVLEASTVIAQPQDHDAVLAWTSHLPQAASSALAAAIGLAGPRGVTYSSGARDTTQLATGSTEMWRDILLLNRVPVLAALEHYEDALGSLRRALQDGSPEAVMRWLSRGARWRRGIGG